MSAKTPAGAADASLHLVAAHLLDGLTAGDLAPCLVHVARVDVTGFELGLLPLDGMHPTDLLLGFSAPSEWHALGMATDGWLYHVADRADPDRPRERVHAVTFVSRSGEVVHRTKVPDRPDLEELVNGGPTGGEQMDLLHRCLDLPTPPPPCGTEVLFAVDWLAALLRVPPVKLRTWDAVLRHHLAESLLDGVWQHEPPVVLRSLSRAWSWSRLRLATAAGTYETPGLAAVDAGWLDEGSFARFVLARCTPLSRLRHEVRLHLRPSLVDRVDELLDAVGVPEHAWPERDDGEAAA